MSAPPNNLKAKRSRCAIYTRKSSEEGLEMEFNSLDAQRDACEAYIASQKSEGWVGLRERYDDGGFSGGSLERPALKQLLADVEAGLIDVIVVYKIDRLSRSLMDFARLVEVFDRNNVTFVSVTQSFNTTTSMGRLTLNILLSFAQFEREVIGERIRDKFAASRKRGIWMGGFVSLGYAVKDRKLIINEDEAKIVRTVFERFVELGSTTLLAREMVKNGFKTRRGFPIDKAVIYKMLNNRIYIGDAVHKGVAYPGEHQPLISRELWDKVHAILKSNPHERCSKTSSRLPALLKGLIFTSTGSAMTPNFTKKKGGRLYRYYVSSDVLKERAPHDNAGPQRLPANVVEEAVIAEVRRMIMTPELITRVIEACRADDPALSERDVVAALKDFDSLWKNLIPAEQTRIIRLLVERVTVGSAGLSVDLRPLGFASLVQSLNPKPKDLAA